MLALSHLAEPAHSLKRPLRAGGGYLSAAPDGHDRRLCRTSGTLQQGTARRRYSAQPGEPSLMFFPILFQTLDTYRKFQLSSYCEIIHVCIYEEVLKMTRLFRTFLCGVVTIAVLTSAIVVLAQNGSVLGTQNTWRDLLTSAHGQLTQSKVDVVTIVLQTNTQPGEIYLNFGQDGDPELVEIAADYFCISLTQENRNFRVCYGYQFIDRVSTAVESGA